MGTLRRALAWEDQREPGAALQLVIAIILCGLISLTALGFGIAYLLVEEEKASGAEHFVLSSLILAIGVALAVGPAVGVRQLARRWEAAHGPAVPTEPLQWRLGLWAGLISRITLAGAVALFFGEGLYAAIAFAMAGVAGLVVAVVAGRRWMRSRSTDQTQEPAELGRQGRHS